MISRRSPIRCAALAATTLALLLLPGCSDSAQHLDDVDAEIEQLRNDLAFATERTSALDVELAEALRRIEVIEEQAVPARAGAGVTASEHPASNADVLSTCAPTSRLCSLDEPLTSTGPFASAPMLWGQPRLEVCVEVLEAARNAPIVVRLVADDPLVATSPAVAPFQLGQGQGACRNVDVPFFAPDLTVRSMLQVDAPESVTWTLYLRRVYAATRPDPGTEATFSGEGIGDSEWFFIDAPAWRYCWVLLPSVPSPNGDPIGTDGRLDAWATGADGDRLGTDEWRDIEEGDHDCGVVLGRGVASIHVSAYGRGAAWRVMVEPLPDGPTFTSLGEDWTTLADRLEVSVAELALANNDLYSLDDVAPPEGSDLRIPSTVRPGTARCLGGTSTVTSNGPVCAHEGVHQ